MGDIREQQVHILYGDFLSALVEVNGIEDTFLVIREKANPLLDLLGVARWDFFYLAPSDIVFSEEVRQQRTFFTDGEIETDELDVIKKEYRTPNKGRVNIVLYHRCGDDWQWKERLHSVVDAMYIAMGRGRVYTSYEQANSIDPITGSPNRLAFVKFVEVCQTNDTIHNYTSAFLNIKNFKWVNDKYGSNAGDRYLRAFCKEMTNIVEADEIFARLGGDNFVIAIKNENIDAVGEKLQHISFSLEMGGKENTFTPKLRAGIYAIRQNDGLHEVMQAMAAAIQYARMPDTTDFVWYQSYMDERDKKLREVQDSFPIGLKNNEFLPYYQPKINLSDMTMCGAEALCRWKRGDSFVSPLDFIPTLEMDGSVVKLDFYMLDKVCKDISDLYSKGLNPGKISVNFSKHHIHDKTLADRVVAIIDRYGVDHSNIEIELTEMYAYDDYEDVHSFIKRMAAEGIAVSLDDFGTGYSSLNMLTGLDADIVKLDKSFMDDIETKPEKHSSMVKNIINMINELGMETLAEGVETVEQCNMLRNWECRSVQGFLFDKPLPFEEFEKRVRNPKYAI